MSSAAISNFFLNDYPRVIQERGKHYFLGGRVRIAKSSGATLTIAVDCTSEQIVSVKFAGKKDPVVKCDCHYFSTHKYCKHSWAGLLAADQAYEAQKDGKKSDDSESGISPEDRDLIYVLSLDPTVTVVASVVQLYDGQRGKAIKGRKRPAFKKPIPVRIKREEIKTLANEADKSLLANYFNIPGVDTDFRFFDNSSTYRVECSTLPLRKENSKDLLDFLCGTRRLYVSKLGKVLPSALRFNEVEHWRLGFRFHERKHGEIQLSAFLDNGEEQLDQSDADLLLAEGIMVMGEEVFCFHAGGAYDWLHRIQNNQQVSLQHDELDERIRDWTESRNGPLLELPDGWEEDVEGGKPRPVLDLRLTVGGRARKSQIPARLMFSYGERRLGTSEAIDKICDVKSRKLYTRDHELEDQYRRSLFDLGLELVDSPNGQYDFRIKASKLSHVIEDLVQKGWGITSKDQSFKGTGTFELAVTSGEDWFELKGGLRFNDEVVSLPKILQAAQSGENSVRLEDGSLGLLPENWMRKWRWFTSMGKSKDDGVRFQQSQGWILDALLSAQQEGITVDAGFKKMRSKLSDFTGIKTEVEVDSFKGELRDYQREALGWFRFLREFSLGGCLADDMGLGKTVQVLAMFEAKRLEGETRPSIVVAPKSVVFNWIQECKRFCPEIGVVDYQGVDRHDLLKNLDQGQIVLTSYGLMRRDIVALKEVSFAYAILDEAQTIKNPGSQTSKAARLLQAENRLALSGTPIENRMFDLWSLFEFLNPGMLGNSASFQRAAAPVEAEEEAPEGHNFLAMALKPFLLRRTKEQVANELPEKTEQTIYCDMEESQQKTYDELLSYYRSSLFKRIDSEGMGRSKMHVLEALLRLRQAACHPGLIAGHDTASASTKVDTLIPQLQEIASEGHKTLVFSQFTKFLDLVQTRLVETNIGFERLDGSTRDRQARVDRFQQDDDCKLFLISLRAGGFGLNLTAAEYVYILDPWWNPAVEAQAIDRAHRIGQTRHVFAYRLITRNTVEEKILALQARKRKLAEAILQGDGGLLRDLTREDLEMLFS